MYLMGLGKGVFLVQYFCIYVDGLFIRLKASNIDCYIGQASAGALGYADDITLLTLSVFLLRQMLDICSQYAFEFSISFNASKSNCIVFRHSGDEIDINRYNFYISDQRIEIVKQWSHLGNIIDNSLQDKDCIYSEGII